MGKVVHPGFCSGRSATRSKRQVCPLKRKTPGFSRHSTRIPGSLGCISAGLRMGFCGKRFARSAMVGVPVEVLTHNIPDQETASRRVCFAQKHGLPWRLFPNDRHANNCICSMDSRVQFSTRAFFKQIPQLNIK